jgi:hypothetical protein
MIVLNSKPYSLFVIVLLLNTLCFGQALPTGFPKVDYLRPDKFIFDEHIDSTKIISLTKLTKRHQNAKVLDTFYIEYYNPKGKVEKKISFSGSPNRSYITRNYYEGDRLVEGTWYNVNTGTRTQLKYFYDDDGNIIDFERKQVYKVKDTIFEESYLNYEYKNGKVIKKTSTLKNSALAGISETTYTYKDSLVLERTSYSTKTKIKTNSVFEYDEKNRRKRQQGFMESLYYTEPHPTADQYYYYNEAGLLARDSLVLYDSKLTKVVEFKYDTKNRLVWMRENITKKATENYLESSFIYKNDRLVAIESIRMKNLEYVTWRIPICRKPDKKSLGKPVKADIIFTYDDNGSRIATDYTLENYPNCYKRINVIEYRD